MATYVPNTKVKGFSEHGFPLVPALEQILAPFFGVKPANTAMGCHPTLAAARDQVSACLADCSHQCAFQASAAANIVALLAFSLTNLVSTSTSISPRRSHPQSLSIHHCGVGHVAAWQTQLHRHLWLQQSAVLER